MYDANNVCRVDRIGYLRDDGCDFVSREWPMLFRIPFQKFATGPLNGEKMHARRSLAYLQRFHDVGMLDALAVAGLPNEPRDGSLVLSQLFAENLDRYNAMCGMISAEDGRSSALSNFNAKRISGE